MTNTLTNASKVLPVPGISGAISQAAVEWPDDIQQLINSHSSYTAAPYTLQLLLGSRCAIFFLDAQLLYVEHQNGSLHSKFVSAEGVRRAFFHEAFDSGWISPGIKRWGKDEDGDWAVCFIPSQLHQIELSHGPHSENERVKIRLDLPSFVLMGYKSSYYLWAVEEEEFNPHAQIYHAPLPNIYGDGRICFGANTSPQVKGPDLKDAWELFLRSPFTCAHINNRSQKFPDHICDALHHFAEHKRSNRTYPVEDLIPYHLTIEEVVNRVITGVPIPTQARMEGDFLIHNFEED
jgi:PRTRC genetic system protein B